MNTMSKYLFPITIILLDIGAGAVYGIHRETAKAVYWIAAAVLNIAIICQ